MKTRLFMMVLLTVLLAWSEGHCGWWLVGETVAEESSTTYSFNIEFDSDTDWSDGYTIGGNDYSAGDQHGTNINGADQSSSYYHSSPYSMETNANNYLLFSNSGNDIYDGDLGYLRFFCYYPSAPTVATYFFEFSESTTSGRIRVRLDSSSHVFVERRDSTGTYVTYTTTATISSGGQQQVDVRWSAANNDLDVRINSGSWEGTDVSMAALTNDITTIRVGTSSYGGDVHYTDDLTIWTDFVGPGD